MVLRSSGGAGGLGRRSIKGPGQLPHYGEIAGLRFLVTMAGSREVVGICKIKLKVSVCGGVTTLKHV